MANFLSKVKIDSKSCVFHLKDFFTVPLMKWGKSQQEAKRALECVVVWVQYVSYAERGTKYIS